MLEWVRSRRGYRGAMLPTTYKKHAPGREIEDDFDHAVGVTMDRLDPTEDEELMMIDPWPGTKKGAPIAVLPALDAAHRDGKYHALIFYWVGWS